jgi:hypothetical protein
MFINTFITRVKDARNIVKIQKTYHYSCKNIRVKDALARGRVGHQLYSFTGLLPSVYSLVAERGTGRGTGRLYSRAGCLRNEYASHADLPRVTRSYAAWVRFSLYEGWSLGSGTRRTRMLVKAQIFCHYSTSRSWKTGFGSK